MATVTLAKASGTRQPEVRPGASFKPRRTGSLPTSILQLAVAHAARSLRISIETAPAPTTKRLAGGSR